MKPFLLSLFFLLSLWSNAQTKIVLSVNQPPELGFSLSRNDTTIEKSTSVVLGTDLVLFGGSGEYTYQWTPAETLSNSGILNPVATPLDTTTYILTVVDKNGCSFSLNYTVNVKDLSVGVDLPGAQKLYDVILFPNPNEGKFKIQIKGPNCAKIKIEIFDSGGRRISDTSVVNFAGNHMENIDLEIRSGIYMVRIDSGSEVISRQFVIR